MYFNKKNPQNFLLHQEQLTDLAPSFLCPCQKFLSKKAKFLITMRATKSFDTILFVSSCKDKLEGYPFSLSLLHVFQFQKFLSKKAEFLITMRATKSFDTILFVSTCLQISEIPVTIKGQISYHNESNQKS